MSKTGVNVKLQHIYSVICSNFVPRWNPFEEYFYSLTEWDGTTDYIARVASMVTVNFSTTNYTNLTNLNLTPIPSPTGEGSFWNHSSQNSHPSSSSGSEGVQECRNGLTPNPSPKGEGSCSNSSTRQLANSSTFTHCFRKWLVCSMRMW